MSLCYVSIELVKKAKKLIILRNVCNKKEKNKNRSDNKNVMF